MLTHAPWDGVPGLWHGFRGVADPPGPPWTIEQAGRRIAVAVPRQVHGTRVVIAGEDSARPEADAVITAPGVPVGVLTADCVPVLLVDRSRRAAAAVHAGWRGAASGVVEAALGRLGHERGSRAADVEAAVGPAIGGCCYEVGDDVREAFRRRTGDATAAAWSRRADRWHVDLRTAVRALLDAAGVGNVAVVGPCTRCGAGYHSFRRDGANAGRQLSFVGWE